jgi:hypothetical protein
VKRFIKFLVLALVLLSFGSVQAQITLNYLDRYTNCELQPTGDPAMQWGDGNHVVGPYFMDLDIVEGDHHMRSVHDTEIILDGSNLTVAGSFLGTVSTDDPASIIFLQAAADLAVNFTPTEPSTVSLAVTLPAGAEAWFFDMTEWNGDFDHQGPGVFTLDDTLVTGHEYLFQVFYSVQVSPGGPQQAEKSVTLSLTVAPDPVATEAVSWGAVKALYR